jgi:hypothetical protein
MVELEGIWRLVDSRAWDEQTKSWSSPYGSHPIGQLTFSGGRMLAALCNGDEMLRTGVARNYSSYGGPFTFDGKTLETTVDMASDPTRIGSVQVRGVTVSEGLMILKPPARLYGSTTQQRELVWERVWWPDKDEQN